MRRIQAVTFDLWGTLIQDTTGSSDKVADIRIGGITRYLNDMGMANKRHEVAAAYLKTGDFLQLTWSKKRDMPVREHVLFLLACIDSKLAGKLDNEDIDEIERIYSEGILYNPPSLLPGAKDTLKAVKSKGYKIGLISNTGRTPGSVLRTVMDKMEILRWFDTTTFSNEALVRKPAQAAFIVTLDRLRVAPKAAVHVGDEAASDIGGAKKAGMHALHCVGEGKRPSDLADAHVKSLDLVPEQIERLQHLS